MIIQHNIPALNTFRQLGINNTGASKALEKLSTGFKVNRAGDGAAGLAISEKMRAQVRGLNQASSNSQDGISLVQAADGALQEVHAILHRIRELSIQGANDTNTDDDRSAIQLELNQLITEIDRISSVTEYNKMTVLDGSLQDGKYGKLISGFNISGVELLTPNPGEAPLLLGMSNVAVDRGERFSMTFDFTLNNDGEAVINGVVQEAGMTILNITLSEDICQTAGFDSSTMPVAITVNPGDNASVIAGNVASMLAKSLEPDWNVTMNGGRVTLEGKFIGKFEGGVSIEVTDDTGAFDPSEWKSNELGVNVNGTEGRDMMVRVNGDTFDTSQLPNNFRTWEDEPDDGAVRWKDVLNRFYTSDGSGSTQGEQFSFKIDNSEKSSSAIIATMDGSQLALQVGANAGYSQAVMVGIQSMSATSIGISEVSVRTHIEARLSIQCCDTAVKMVSDQRAALGAVQNRLEHTIANLDTVAENLQDAESRIRDTDMAKEMMNFTRYSILMQSAQAMMAQSNALPQGVLQLLR